jgi:hypothetical protein
LNAVPGADHAGDRRTSGPHPGMSIGCITSVHVMPPVDLFEARRCTYIPTIPTVYRRTH